MLVRANQQGNSVKLSAPAGTRRDGVFLSALLYLPIQGSGCPHYRIGCFVCFNVTDTTTFQVLSPHSKRFRWALYQIYMYPKDLENVQSDFPS